MNRRAILAGVGTMVVLVAIGVGVLLLTGGGSGEPTRAPASAQPASAAAEQATGDLNTCAGRSRTTAAPAIRGELAKIVNAPPNRSPRRGHHRRRIRRPVRLLLANCHGIMHTVAREYALRTHLTPAKLMDNLPAPTTPAALPATPTASSPRSPRRSRSDGPGRQQVVRRVRDALPALQLHARLRARVHAPQQRQDRAVAADVRQLGSGARRLRAGHLSRLLVRGERDRRHDEARGPRPPIARLCGEQPAEFVRPCWYRAFVETAAGTRTESAADFENLCGGLTASSARPGDRLDRDRPARPAQPARDLRLARGDRTSSPASGDEGPEPRSSSRPS